MYSVIFVFLILSFLIPLRSTSVCRKKPVFVVTQGVVENEDGLPISIFWYYPNFTEARWLLVRCYNYEKPDWLYFKIESYTGFYELSRKTLDCDGGPDKYCIARRSEDETIESNLLCNSKIQWMFDRKDVLKYFSLRDLIIPGTHQSAAYGELDDESLNNQSFISRWTLCQSKSIKTQLMEGIRYLDLRPGFLYVNGKKMYITTHGVFNLIPMDEVVKQICEFMDLSEDIVIVSFREFNKGFETDRDHEDFINYLEISFAGYIHPRQSWMDKLNRFWVANRRLILSYGHNAYRASDYMWPPIVQNWANAQTINQLHSHLDVLHRMYSNPFKPYAAMVEFTHSATTIAQDIWSGDMSLRHWAERLGRYIPRWYTEEWNTLANIVAVDFYQTSGIVDLAIQLNEKRATDPRYCRPEWKFCC